jgi:hypothetical protein
MSEDNPSGREDEELARGLGRLSDEEVLATRPTRGRQAPFDDR